MKHIRRDLVKSVLASFRLPRCLTIAVILSLPSTVLAEEDTGVAPAMRTWSDSRGRFSVQAKPIAVEGKTVRLKTAHGRESAVPKERLSEQDQRYIRQQSTVWTYDIPGGEQFASPDYEVTVESAGKAKKSFVHYSYGLDQYTRYEWSLKPAETRAFPKNVRGMASHSAAVFSFDGEVTVRVKVKKDAAHITLPLKSAKVLPSSYNIPCSIEGGDTIVFTLDRPEKVAVIPNYEQVWNTFENKAKGHVPAQSWKETYGELSKQKSWHGEYLIGSIREGYKNPLIVLAHPKEKNIPKTNVADTLLVKPGDRVTQEQLDKYKTIWFAPGIHDLSRMGAAPWFQTLVKKGQTVYIEGGSYVMARFKRNEELGKGETTIRGRGVISGIGHKWVLSFPEGSQVINIDNLSGVTITDRATFGIYGGHHIDDIAMLGSWHGNNDGPDYIDDCVIQNSFLMAHDDNLKLNNNTHAKHIVIWQLANAHAIMVKEMRDKVTFANSVVEDVDIIAYYTWPTSWKHPWGRLSPGAISCVLGKDMEVKNFTFQDIRIESPYLYRVFSFYNLDASREYTPQWLLKPGTSESSHSKLNGMTFENITVNSPVIAYRSLIGSAYDNSLSNIRFRNVEINGTIVTEENKNEFFEIEHDKVKGLTFSEEAVSRAP